jgi:xanthine dehydrogenase accessory factor
LWFLASHVISSGGERNVAVWDLVEQGRELRRQRRPFALATVVRCERPTSAHPGDQALITDDGSLLGWIGGSCSRPVIVREALRVLHSGHSSLVRLGASDAPSDHLPEGVVAYPMTCSSGGTLEVFVDPCLPTPQAVLVGHTPITEALAALASTAGFDVVICDPHATAAAYPAAQQIIAVLDPAAVALDARTYIVVATHDEADEEILATALHSPAGYVALVASRRRAEACRETLLAAGLTHAQVARLKAPAGLNIGATTPAQIAVSIVAEMVQHLVSAAPTTHEQPEAPLTEGVRPAVLDPVCGMTVDPTAETPSCTYDGTVYYFCCPGCKRRFEGDPQRFLVSDLVGSEG